MNRTGKTPLRRTLPTAVDLALLCVLFVCGCGQENAPKTQPPLDRVDFNPAALNEAAKLSARPIESAPGRQIVHPPAVTSLDSARQPHAAAGETQAEYQHLPNALPSTEAGAEPLMAIRLPPVDETDEIVAATPRDQAEPLAPGESRGGVPEPTLESAGDTVGAKSGTGGHVESAGERAAFPRDFAAAFAVSPKRTVDAEDRLAPLSGPSEPTPALIAVARQADAHITRGFELAQRGAAYTARAEFLRALQLSVAALDEQRQTVAHSRAMANGLRAMEEAEDFLSAVALERAPAVEAIVGGHRTPILHDASFDGVTPLLALQRYLTYAQDQLQAAAGDLQPAAAALYALGKLETTTAKAEIGSLPAARAAVYLQAALTVNPGHALAANELGVLLARHGRLEHAKGALLHSVRSAPQPTAWRNLAIVHHRLGELDLANRADWESRKVVIASQKGRASIEAKPRQDVSVPLVEWVDPATFVKTTNITSGVPLPAPQRAARAPSTTKKSAVKSNTKSAARWWPWPSKTR